MSGAQLTTRGPVDTPYAPSLCASVSLPFSPPPQTHIQDNTDSDAAAGAVLIKTLQQLESQSSSTAAAAESLQSKRAALLQLRSTLNSQAAAKLEGLIGTAVGKPHAGPQQA